ncbi:GntR family transcriptional regulator [Microbacterium sp. JZ70]|uniref:GntR family transcriptional regulator n=1 Tax=Microbacterium barkeri TaxID=33917 RepID=A0A9W6H6D5_9MICO|nr:MULTISPECIES: GntR family transcriptional regulator [Microbacterium]MDI6944894.1 GntR family transcriptional regulator [Microbacterium barkeri]MDR6877856.1 DNA-binding GntR family transcriptional regulator [Microbacterium barkeri]WRH18681.1 FCD domain-containing protein [Microbacterium sp. JZ37]GLJ62918.1 GntR family transcriptional regulator [Microbacterium barkeri]
MRDKVERGVSLGTQVADIIRQRIVRGELQAGDRLTEEGVAEEFQVSRGPVRDAVSQLSYEGLVEVRRPRGIYILGLSADDVEQLYSLRGALERLAVQRAMDVTDDEPWRRVWQCVERMAVAADEGDHPAFQKADVEFHSLFYEMARHPRLLATWRQYEPTFAALLDVTINHDDDLHESSEAHRRLYDVLRSGDRAAAEAELIEHLRGAEERMRLELVARR